MAKNKLKDGLTISRRDDSACYMVYCQNCDWVFYSVASWGNMLYRTALGVARRHRCE